MIDPLHTWMNVAAILALVGAATFFTVIPSSTWFNDD